MGYGHIYFYHSLFPYGANGDNVQWCLSTWGQGKAVTTRVCDQSDDKQKWYFTSDSISQAEQSIRPGLTPCTVYWRGSNLAAATNQCMYTHQVTKRLHVATCTDMQYSFGHDDRSYQHAKNNIWYN